MYEQGRNNGFGAGDRPGTDTDPGRGIETVRPDYRRPGGPDDPLGHSEPLIRIRSRRGISCGVKLILIPLAVLALMLLFGILIGIYSAIR